MKRWKKISVSLLAICMLLALSGASVLAADADGAPGSDGYAYTVTLSAGEKGTVNGQSKLVYTDIQAGSPIEFDKDQIQPTDAKYYVKGIRLSGRDNEDVFAVPSFTVTSDADYVAAYGIKANMVGYTVNYQDGDGNELAPSRTFYGDVGDKPVVAYLYIENYVPEALALTKTLSANEAENVFTFVYTPGESGALIPGTTTVITTTQTVPGTTAAGATGTAGAAGAAAGATGTATGAEANEAAGAAAGNQAAADAGAGGETVESPDEETPQGVKDLDDEETPAGNIDASKDASGSKTPFIVGGVIAAAAVIALAALLIVLKKRRE